MIRRALPLLILLVGCPAITAFGQPATQTEFEKLIENLSSDDAESRFNAAKKLADSSDGAAIDALIKALDDKQPEVRVAAADSLGAFGTKATDAKEVLTRLLDDKERDETGQPVWFAAARNLGRIDPGNLKPWIERLKRAERIGCYAAAAALYEIGPDAKPAVPDVIKLLTHENSDLRSVGCYACMGIGPAAADAVPPLIDLLSDEDFHTQYWACRALASIGAPGSIPSVPKLIELAGDGAASVRRNAVAAIGQIGPGAGKQILDPLTKALDDWSYPVRTQAAIALGRLGPFAKGSVPKLKEVVAKPSFGAYSPAALALWQITGEVDPAIDVLMRELGGLNAPWEAAEAFQTMGPAAKSAVPRLIARLDAGNSEARLFAIDALASIGPDSKPAISKLVQLKDDPNDDVRAAAAQAIDVITGKE